MPRDEEAGHSQLSLIEVQLTSDPSFHPMLMIPPDIWTWGQISWGTFSL